MIKNFYLTAFKIQAVQFTGHNTGEILTFINPEEVSNEVSGDELEYMEIQTLHSGDKLYKDDWIIKGSDNILSIMKNENFEKNYTEI